MACALLAVLAVLAGVALARVAPEREDSPMAERNRAAPEFVARLISHIATAHSQSASTWSPRRD